MACLFVSQAPALALPLKIGHEAEIYEFNNQDLFDLFHPDRTLIIVDDFINTSAGNHGWIAALTGTSSVTDIASQSPRLTSKDVGIIEMSLDKDVGNRASYFTEEQIVLGGGVTVFETKIMVDVVTSNETVQYRIGLDDTTGTAPGIGVWFEADLTVTTDTLWRCVSATNAIKTTVTSNFMITPNEWIYLKWQTDNVGTSVDFYINESFAANITSNIPRESGASSGPNFWMNKFLGSTKTAYIWIDWIYFRTAFNDRRNLNK